MRGNKKLVLAVLITFIVTVILTTFAISALGLVDIGGIGSLLKLKNYINTYYYEPVDKNKLLDGAMHGMVNAIGDEYSEYMNKEEYKQISEITEGSYVGIGVHVSIDQADKSIVVVSPIEDTPAEKAGLTTGDKILAINAVPVGAENFKEAIEMLRGKEKESDLEFKLSVLKAGAKTPTELTIKRQRIMLKSVKSKPLNENVGYIRITNFAANTDTEFTNAINSFNKDKLKGLVIDLRFNPGGILDSTKNIADMLIPADKIITYFVYKDGHKEEFKTQGDYLNIPIAVIINGGSASASEVLSAALRDNNRAVIVGTKSFGKGIVQSLIPFTRSSKGEPETVVKLTTSRYFTPKGESIHKKGIEPDIKVELPGELKTKLISELTILEDTQLQKAFDAVREKIK